MNALIIVTNDYHCVNVQVRDMINSSTFYHIYQLCICKHPGKVPLHVPFLKSTLRWEIALHPQMQGGESTNSKN